MDAPLHNQIAVVTGAGRGIGRAIALRLASAGCSVAAISRSQSELEETVALAEASGRGRLMAVPADVTRDHEIEQALLLVIERLGHIQILVNAAGFAPPRTPFVKTSLQDWDLTLATCLRAPMVLSRLVLPDMLAHRDGAIVNIVSSATKHRRPGEAAYVAAKSGLLGFTHSLFREVRDHGVKVVAVCPGLADTGFIPPNRRVDRSRFLQPDDIAEVVFHAVTATARTCPTEIVVEPQLDPEPD